MPQEEVFGERDRAYSAWHRRLSTGRFIGIEKAQLLAMIDLDASLYIEYDNGTKDPLILVETARDVGQRYKCVTVTLKLAIMAGLPCYVVLYTLSDLPNPADPTQLDIASFRVKRLYPNPENNWRPYLPQEWAEALVRIREWSARRIDKGLFLNSTVPIYSAPQ